jgi:hypothetical protein
MTEHYNADCADCVPRKEWAKINSREYRAAQMEAEDRRVKAISDEYEQRLTDKDSYIDAQRLSFDKLADTSVDLRETAAKQRRKIIGLTIAVVVLVILLGVACMIAATGGMA